MGNIPVDHECTKLLIKSSLNSPVLSCSRFVCFYGVSGVLAAVRGFFERVGFAPATRVSLTPPRSWGRGRGKRDPGNEVAVMIRHI